MTSPAHATGGTARGSHSSHLPLLGCRIGNPSWRGQAHSSEGARRSWSGPWGRVTATCGRQDWAAWRGAVSPGQLDPPVNDAPPEDPTEGEENLIPLPYSRHYPGRSLIPAFNSSTISPMRAVRTSGVALWRRFT